MRDGDVRAREIEGMSPAVAGVAEGGEDGEMGGREGVVRAETRRGRAGVSGEVEGAVGVDEEGGNGGRGE